VPYRGGALDSKNNDSQNIIDFLVPITDPDVEWDQQTTSGALDSNNNDILGGEDP